MAFGATLKVSVGGDGLAFGTAVTQVVPLVVTVVTLAALWWWSWRDEAASASGSRRDLLVRAGVSAAGVAFALLVLQAVFALPGGFAPEELTQLAALDVSVAPWRSGLSALLVLAVAGALARASSYAARTGTSALEVLLPRAAPLADAVDVARTWLLTGAAIGLPVVLVVMVCSGEVAFGAGSAAVLLGGVHLVGWLLGLATFGAVRADLAVGMFGMGDDDAQTLTLFSGDVSRWWLAAVAIPALACAVAGVRFALRRSLTSDALRAWWLTAAAVTAGLTGLAVLTQASVRITGLGDSMGGAMTVGLDTARTFLVALAWGALVALAARFLTPVVAGTTPGLARRLAGRRLQPAWAAALGAQLPAAPTVPRPRAEPGDDGQTHAPAGPFGGGAQLSTATVTSLSPRARRWLLVGAGVLVVVGGGLFASARVLESTVYSPSKPVERYLEHLAAGNVTAAAAEAGIPKDTPLAPLGGPGTRIVDAQVVSDRVDGEQATVKVEFAVAAQRRSATYTLEAADSRFGVVTRWQLLLAPDTISVTAPDSFDVTVNGAAATSDVYTALPGLYDFAGAARLLDVTAQPVTVADGGEHHEVTFDATPAPQAQTQVTQALTQQLAECATEATSEYTDCPFSYSGSEIVSDVKWTLDALPQITLDYVDGELGFSTATPGVARITGTTQSWFTEQTEPFSAMVPIDVSGTVEVRGDQLVLDVHSNL